jgi:hypothetical protein
MLAGLQAQLARREECNRFILEKLADHEEAIKNLQEELTTTQVHLVDLPTTIIGVKSQQMQARNVSVMKSSRMVSILLLQIWRQDPREFVQLKFMGCTIFGM